MVVRATMTGDEAVRTLCSRLGAERTPLAANGLWGSSAPMVAALLADRLQRPLLYICPHLEQADNARDDMETTLDRPVELLPAWEMLPGEGSGSGEIAGERARLCQALRAASGAAAASRAEEPPGNRTPPVLIVAPIQALTQPVPSPRSLDGNTLTLAVGDRREPREIAAWLSQRGFQRLDQVEQPGDFAVRGGILDIFATADADPVRLEFFGDEIESIRPFEAGSQRSTRSIDSTHITLPPDPACVGPKETTTFLNYLPADALVALHEPVEIDEVARAVMERLGYPRGHFRFEAIVRRLADFRQLHLSRYPVASVEAAHAVPLSCEPVSTFDSKAADATRQLVDLARAHTVVVFCDNRGEEDRLKELIGQASSEAVAAGGDGTGPGAGPGIQTRIGHLSEGFIWRPGRPGGRSAPAGRVRPLLVLPHHQLFRRTVQRRRLRKVPASRPIESFLDLREGDYVVHVNHGIARYLGMKTMRKGDSGKSEEFLTLRFADDAKIHVPVLQIDLVQKYVGAKACRPPLSKLGGARWAGTKARVEEAVTDLAGELLRVQAERESRPGIAYPRDTRWQTEFESAFPYPETPDQATAARDIKEDQIRVRPMDRLLCGDVGYGKTELAMRAAFKTVEFGKQVAVLVPTTVLAEQHYRTMSERMADYPFRIECLNRFRSARRQKEIVAATRKGQVDILIGTHRIVSKDVGFADLGLVVVDEEQRFGVEHKERLKRLRSTVDVLTLTATPIPRTLHMAMVGLRDISSLATPPMDRRSISTRVCNWSDDLIREAVVRELNRDGQVFFVHNRVQSIRGVADRIAARVPEARIVVGHGQMSGDELEAVMLRFVRHEADILVCTTIIEAGLDIPNANTIFIDQADCFGLADLHQLRGRVGRYKHRAYCYLLLAADRPMTDSAARRLKAIEEFSELGAGFRIAMRDLEIRGAGNILGPEQSGQIAAVGYELYCQLLEKSVKRMRGEPCRERVAVHLELNVEAYVPKGYIPSDRQRMECYRRLAACRGPDDVEQLERDLVDAFGAYPETVATLLTLAEIRVRASRVGVRSIVKKEPDLIFRFESDVKQIEPFFTGVRGAVSLPDGRTLHWRPPDAYFHGDTLLVVLRNLFREGPAAVPRSGPLRSPRSNGAPQTARRRGGECADPAPVRRQRSPKP